MKQIYIYIYWNLNIRTKPFEIRTLSISGPYFLRSLCWISKLQLMLNSMQFNGINDSTFSDANSIWHIFRPIYWYLKLFGHWLSEYQVYHSCWYLSIVVFFCYILNKSKQKTKKQNTELEFTVRVFSFYLDLFSQALSRFPCSVSFSWHAVFACFFFYFIKSVTRNRL